METRRTHWLLAFALIFLVHAALLLAYRYWPARPLMMEPAGIRVELASPAPRKEKPPTPEQTVTPRPPAQPTQPEHAPVPTPEPQQAVLPDPAPLSAPPSTPATTEGTTPAVEAPIIYPPSRLTRAPRFRQRVDVVYPPAERAGGAEAQVLAEAVIDTIGHVVDVTIIESAGAHFDAAVIVALRESTFAPGYLDSVPVMTRVQIPFRFKLK